jgi:predicted nucleotidyltransferase
MFTSDQRDAIRERVLEIARADHRVTAGALVGSSATDDQDRWSDIDITFGIVDGASIQQVLDDWTELFVREFGALHYWDLPSGPSIYRVFLLPSGLEIDLSVTPQQQFAARGARFRSLFGTHKQVPPAPRPSPRFLMGLCWHHVLHANSSIERGKPWRAEHWISALRDHTIELACVRLGEEPGEARGVDRLPAAVTGPLAGALVRSLDKPELRRALAAATACFINELEAWDPDLCARLKPLLEEFGTQQ